MLLLVMLWSLGSALLSTYPWASYLNALSEFLHLLYGHSRAGQRGHCEGYMDFCVVRHPDWWIGLQQALPKCFQLSVCPLSCLTWCQNRTVPHIWHCLIQVVVHTEISLFCFSFLSTSFLPPCISPHLKITGAESPGQNSSSLFWENFAMTWTKSSFGQRHLYGPSPQHWVWKFQCTSGFRMLTLAES